MSYVENELSPDDLSNTATTAKNFVKDENQLFIDSWFEKWQDYINIEKSINNDDPDALNVVFYKEILEFESMSYEFTQNEYFLQQDEIKNFENLYHKNNIDGSGGKGMKKYINYLMNVSIYNPYAIFRQTDEKDDVFLPVIDDARMSVVCPNNKNNIRQYIINNVIKCINEIMITKNISEKDYFGWSSLSEFSNDENYKIFNLVSIFPGDFFTDICLMLEIKKNFKTVKEINYIIFAPESLEYKNFEDKKQVISSNLLIELYQYAFLKKLMSKRDVKLNIKIYTTSIISNRRLNAHVFWAIDYLSEKYPSPWQLPCLFNYFANSNCIVANMLKNINGKNMFNECWVGKVINNKNYLNLKQQEEEFDKMYKQNTIEALETTNETADEKEKRQRIVLHKNWKVYWRLFYINCNFEKNIIAITDINYYNKKQSIYDKSYKIIENSLAYVTNYIYGINNWIKTIRR